MFNFKSSVVDLLCILTLLLCEACAVAQTSKTLVVRPETGAFAGNTFYTNSHALVIGISKYGFLPKDTWLNYAARDAADMRDVLIRSYGFLPENVTILLNDQATKAGIEHALASLADNNKVKKDDRVLIYFSGHGQTVKTSVGGDTGFLIPYDAKVDLSKPENSGEYLDTCVPMDNVWNYIGLSPAKHTLLIADACFGGLLIHSRSLTSERPSATFVTSMLSRPAQQAITAGGKDEAVQEDPKLGHGYLTFKLLEELNAQAGTPDTVFLASQLASSLKTSVGNLTNAKQTPQFGNHEPTEGDFVFLTTAPKPVPPLALPTGLGANGSPQVAKTKINPKDGAVMIFIPAGPFLMGDDDDNIYDFENVTLRNNPRHTVQLSGYWIYKDLVMVGMYKQFCKETGKQMPKEPTNRAGEIFNPNWSKEDHPMVDVSWNDAVAYCQWAGVTLPTEAQWEKAARGVNGLLYPWGNAFDSTKVWGSKTEAGDSGGTHRVGELAVSPYGCTDMAGNVWQWCADYYDMGFWGGKNEGADPVNLTKGNRGRVMRGGAWYITFSGGFRTAFRGSDMKDEFGGPINGFRCAAGE